MVDVATTVSFPVTVEDNMHEYSHREVTKALGARELMARLAYSSSQMMLELHESGRIVNCGMTAQDVRDADAIFGMSLEALRGKPKKQTPRAAQVSLAPRVTKLRTTCRRRWRRGRLPPIAAGDTSEAATYDRPGLRSHELQHGRAGCTSESGHELAGLVGLGNLVV
jgi:hypothetical protein